MFRVKICGITRPSDAEAAAGFGADAIGLNFWPNSRRAVTIDVARTVLAVVPEHVCRVAVVVNPTLGQVERLLGELPIDLLQLHGDEPPELAHEIGALAMAPRRGILRAFRVDEDVAAVNDFVRRCGALGVGSLSGVLFDAAAGADYGGTGRKGNWGVARTWVQAHPELPLVLAGGLNPENVAEAIHTVGPAAVDTASGVESSPGVKDPEKMRLFIAAALGAWSAKLGHPL